MPRMARQRKTLAGLLQPLSRAARPRGRATGVENPALEAIWHAVCTIPHGRVATYGGVARAAGLPGRARQAGFALRVAGEGKFKLTLILLGSLPLTGFTFNGLNLPTPAAARSRAMP